MENIYIQWHFTTHGVAYFKHILSAFYSGSCSLKQKHISAKDLSQEKLHFTFENSLKNPFLFDKIYYFIADSNAFNKIVTYNIFRKIKFYEDDELLREKLLNGEWRDVIEKQLPLQEEYLYIKNHYPDKADEMWEFVWRNIQHYPVDEQIWWLKTHTNFDNLYNSKFEVIDMTEKENIHDLTDYMQLSAGMQNQLNKIFKRHKDANFIINPVLTSREVQVVWFSLANAGFLPPSTRFISTYDRKDKYPEKRFKLFDIKEIPANIVSQITDKITVFEKPLSQSRKLTEAKMEYYIKSGFSILLLGERGIGKTHLAEKFKNKDQNFISVNCAAFTDNMIAESILFGYKKGAFTDAKEDRKGVFEQANNGILFFDEIHHLDKLTQAKLMKAIETDNNNFFTIKRLGDKNEQKVKTILIFASNRTVEELRQLLLPDFFDRITQLAINLPPLRDAKNDLQRDFEFIWKQMRFDESFDFDKYVKNDKKLSYWLTQLKLFGNYRDLQKIAIYYKTFLSFDDKIRKIIPQKSAFEFTKNEFESYVSYEYKTDEKLFDFEKSPDELISLFKKQLAEKLITKFGSAQKVVDNYGNITTRTIYAWRKGKKEI